MTEAEWRVADTWSMLRYLNHDLVRTQRTMLLSTLVLLGVGNLPRVLTAAGETLSLSDRRLLWWVPAAVLLYAACPYWPLAAEFFQLTPRDPARWGVVVAAAGAGLLLSLAQDRLWGAGGRGTATAR
jgi:hypothetical protein